MCTFFFAKASRFSTRLRSSAAFAFDLNSSSFSARALCRRTTYDTTPTAEKPRKIMTGGGMKGGIASATAAAANLSQTHVMVTIPTISALCRNIISSHCIDPRATLIRSDQVRSHIQPHSVPMMHAVVPRDTYESVLVAGLQWYDDKIETTMTLLVSKDDRGAKETK